MGGVGHLWFYLFIVLSIVGIAGSASEDFKCVYTVYVRTGGMENGGTDSNITLTLFDENWYGIRIWNLEVWGGQMGPGYNYFERDHLDIFFGRGPCLNRTICTMNLTSDGSSPHHAWNCNYVEVTSTGPHITCSQRHFSVDQWLANDTSPYNLTAIRDICGRSNNPYKPQLDARVIDIRDAFITSRDGK